MYKYNNKKKKKRINDMKVVEIKMVKKANEVTLYKDLPKTMPVPFKSPKAEPTIPFYTPIFSPLFFPIIKSTWLQNNRPNGIVIVLFNWISIFIFVFMV